MKTKIVLWGTNARDEKVLIALELLTETSSVKVYTFAEADATEEFSQLMMKEWRDGNAVEFPAQYDVEERPLSISSRLLPDELKAEREDVVVRAQTEWHFIVLSAKLNEAYQSELEDLRDRIEKLSKYESGVWEELKAFWDKVQAQVRDRNLFRDHADQLRDRTNTLFSEMKVLRTKMDEEFKKRSEENWKTFMENLEQIEEKISKDQRMQAIFDDLKNLQRQFKKAKFTREHRTKIWERMDAAFKTVKEKRFGPGANQDKSPLERLNRRYNGLLAAIEKMERSIKRDEDDLKFQQKKIERSDGQLEAQIRQAKIKMIEERVNSKRDKLEDMQKTKAELEKRRSSLEKKEAERKAREEAAKAKKEAEKKIAEDIKAAAKATYAENSEELEKAAAALQEDTPDTEAAAGKKEESLLKAASVTMGEALKDVVDTVKAVAEVMEGKIGEAIEEVREKMKEEPVASPEEPPAAESEGPTAEEEE
jgi:chromosome segregation ATPase